MGLEHLWDRPPGHGLGVSSVPGPVNTPAPHLYPRDWGRQVDPQGVVPGEPRCHRARQGRRGLGGPPSSCLEVAEHMLPKALGRGPAMRPQCGFLYYRKDWTLGPGHTHVWSVIPRACDGL